jgi:hypothetical protein
MKSAIDILREALREMGADGLANGFGCGCGLDDLTPCEVAPLWCYPARRTLPPEGEDPGEAWYEPMAVGR